MPPSGTAGNLKRPRRPLILVFAGKKEKRLHVGFTSGSVLFESLSQSLELVKIGTEEAINSEMENQFHEFLEECVAVDGPGRIGHYVRKILAIARGAAARVPRDATVYSRSGWSVVTADGLMAWTARLDVSTRRT